MPHTGTQSTNVSANLREVMIDGLALLFRTIQTPTKNLSSVLATLTRAGMVGPT